MIELCGFEGRYRESASSLDKSLIKIWHQDHESVEWRGMKKIINDWKFDHINVLKGVSVKRGTGIEAGMRDGIIMG